MKNPGQYLTEQQKEYIDRLMLDRVFENKTIVIGNGSVLMVDRAWNSSMLEYGSQGFPRFTFYKQGQGPRKKQRGLWE